MFYNASFWLLFADVYFTSLIFIFSRAILLFQHDTHSSCNHPVFSGYQRLEGMRSTSSEMSQLRKWRSRRKTQKFLRYNYSIIIMKHANCLNTHVLHTMHHRLLETMLSSICLIDLKSLTSTLNFASICIWWIFYLDRASIPKVFYIQLATYKIQWI